MYLKSAKLHEREHPHRSAIKKVASLLPATFVLQFLLFGSQPDHGEIVRKNLIPVPAGIVSGLVAPLTSDQVTVGPLSELADCSLPAGHVRVTLLPDRVIIILPPPPVLNGP